MVPSARTRKSVLPPDHFGDDVQAPPGTVWLLAHAHHVAGAVADERLGIRAQPGHDRFSHLARRDRVTGLVEHFEDDALAHQQHLPLRRLVGGEADVAAAELVGHRNAEHLADQRALVVVQRLAGGAHDLQARQAEPAIALPGMRGQQRQRTGIAIDATGPEGLHRVEIAIHARRRHREGVEHQLVDEPVAHRLHPVGLVQLDRGAPEVHLGLARLDAPPAARAHAPGGVRRLSPAPEMEDQRLSAGAAGVVPERAAGDTAPDEVVAVVPPHPACSWRAACAGRRGYRDRRVAVRPVACARDAKGNAHRPPAAACAASRAASSSTAPRVSHWLFSSAAR